jgi:hypothetical protein
MWSCGICGHDVDAADVHRRDTGDFHRACFDGLRTAGIGLSNCAEEQAECQLCSRRIARGSPIVEFFGGIDRVVHLGCFFGTANGHTRSLGACAARRSPADRGRALRGQSDALRALSRRLFAVAHA